MLLRMKTTLVLEDALVRRLKAHAARTGRTLSGLVADMLRRGLDDETRKPSVRDGTLRLPEFDMGVPSVDVSDRAALDLLIEAHDRARR
jgi:hypothetical protein